MTGNHFLGRVARLNRALVLKRISGETFDAIMGRIMRNMEDSGYYL